LPGLIEGASQGVGLGHEFLRHVDRTRVLIHLVEPFPTDGGDAVKNYHTIRNELKTYSEALAEKPEIVCVSKAELTDATTVRDALAAELGREVLLISGKANELIVEQRRLEREAKERAKPVEFATEKAIREMEGETP
jgi:GTPase